MAAGKVTPLSDAQRDRLRACVESGMIATRIAQEMRSVGLTVDYGQIQVLVAREFAGLVALKTDRMPLPAGHPTTWGAITAGTCLA